MIFLLSVSQPPQYLVDVEEDLLVVVFSSVEQVLVVMVAALVVSVLVLLVMVLLVL